MDSQRQSADFMILGAGVIGTSIAFHLALRKPGRILIADKAFAGQGGSGRSSALIRLHYTFPQEVQLAVKSLQIFANWQTLVGRPGDFHKTGFVRIVPPNEAGRLRANVAMQREHGANAQVVTAAELKELEPAWNVDDVVAAAYEPDSGYGDGAGVAQDFLTRAREMGAAYLPQARIVALRVEGGRVRGVVTEHGEIEAPVVILALGPWTAPLLQKIGVNLPLETEYHEVAVLKNPPGMRASGCACIDSIHKLYFRSEGRDLTLVGTFYGPRGMDPDGVPDAVPVDALLKTALAASQRIPSLEEGSLVRGIPGVYDMSPDARPLLGAVPGVGGLYLAAGFSGMGFKISPAVGLVMAELLLDGRATTVDLTAFRPGRFAEGQPIRAACEYQDD